MVLTVRGVRPALLMHRIRSLHVNWTGVPVPLYHWLSTALTKALFDWFRDRISCTTKQSLSSRVAKLSQVVLECRAIKPEIDLFLSHGWVIIRSSYVMPAAGMETSIHYAKFRLIESILRQFWMPHTSEIQVEIIAQHCPHIKDSLADVGSYMYTSFMTLYNIIMNIH